MYSACGIRLVYLGLSSVHNIVYTVISLCPIGTTYAHRLPKGQSCTERICGYLDWLCNLLVYLKFWCLIIEHFEHTYMQRSWTPARFSDILATPVARTLFTSRQTYFIQHSHAPFNSPAFVVNEISVVLTADRSP